VALSDVIPVGDVPSFVAASPSGTHLYVTNQRSNTVSVIETSTRTVIRIRLCLATRPSVWLGA
jgi:DNA-binding beta-propeller fold protein YncE